jgi:hypothetical protein
MPAQARVLSQRVEEARTLIEAESFALADGKLSELSDQINAFLQLAQETQLNEDRRNYIVGGIVQVMSQMGFVVQAGSPALEHPGRAGSATIIHARRVGGGSVAVSVPQHGEIWYDVDGFPKRMELGIDGRAGPTCDEAEAQIERMHAVLDQDFGVKMSELLWEGKPKRPERKRAERLPDVSAAQRRIDEGS